MTYRSHHRRTVSRARRWTVRLTALSTTLLVGVALAVVPASAGLVSVHPNGWFWNWWYTGPNDFGYWGGLTGVEVNGSGTDFGNIRRVSGTLKDTDPNDGACADVKIFGPDRAQLLDVVNCNGDPVTFQTPEIDPRNGSNQVVFDIHQVKQDFSNTGAEFRDRIQSSIKTIAPDNGGDDSELRGGDTWIGWTYHDDSTVQFWAHRHGENLDGTATMQPDGTRTANATVTVLTPTRDDEAVTGYLWGDQGGSIQSTPSNGNPQQVSFGRSMLAGNLYYEVQRKFEGSTLCIPVIACGRVVEINDLTGKVTLPGSGM